MTTFFGLGNEEVRRAPVIAPEFKALKLGAAGNNLRSNYVKCRSLGRLKGGHREHQRPSPRSKTVSVNQPF
jgi:hypothetical protein